MLRQDSHGCSFYRDSLRKGPVCFELNIEALFIGYFWRKSYIFGLL